jgi:predicted dehydrogenase
LAASRHTLAVFDPGHFHAALTLRERHPRLDDEVHVYAEDGPDLERFLAAVQAFNQRAEAPTRWKMRVYRGRDCLQRLCRDRPGDIAVVAGRNDTKMSSIRALHAAGFLVLGDKPWLIDPGQLPMLEEVAASPPLSMDIMTERHEVTNRLQKALTEQPWLFGGFRDDGDPAIYLKSVHHLRKTVNGRPLVRPPWYFDVAVQGEGITDVTTHLVDLAQWLAGGEALHAPRAIELLAARQWPTEVPRALFAEVTGLPDFPAHLADRVSRGALRLLCNASIDFRLRGVPVRVESVWELSAPEGGGDTHYARLRGTLADLTIEQNVQTRFLPEVFVEPRERLPGSALAQALAPLQSAFPGVDARAQNGGVRLEIPAALRSTHEQHFARVLDRFLGCVDGDDPPPSAADLVNRYALLARAATMSRGA